MRLTQPCSHSISFPANERPHFQQVFIFSPLLFVFRPELFLKIQFHGSRLREQSRQLHGRGTRGIVRHRFAKRVINLDAIGEWKFAYFFRGGPREDADGVSAQRHSGYWLAKKRTAMAASASRSGSHMKTRKHVFSLGFTLTRCDWPRLSGHSADGVFGVFIRILTAPGDEATSPLFFLELTLQIFNSQN